MKIFGNLKLYSYGVEMFNDLWPFFTICSNGLVVFLDLSDEAARNVDWVDLPTIFIFGHEL